MNRRDFILAAEAAEQELVDIILLQPENTLSRKTAQSARSWIHELIFNLQNISGATYQTYRILVLGAEQTAIAMGFPTPALTSLADTIREEIKKEVKCPQNEFARKTYPVWLVSAAFAKQCREEFGDASAQFAVSIQIGGQIYAAMIDAKNIINAARTAAENHITIPGLQECVEEYAKMCVREAQ